MCGRFSLRASGKDLAERFLLPEVAALAPRYNVAPGQPIVAARRRRTGSDENGSMCGLAHGATEKTLEAAGMGIAHGKGKGLPEGVAAGDRELVLLRWGLVPWWAEDPRMGARMINARSETAAVRPAFRDAFRYCRCLVPADGFYEWRRSSAAGTKRKSAGRKQPFFIGLRDGSPFAFAGLWERWERPGQPAIESCAILTTEANELVRPLHDRMPVIIRPEDYDLWLDPTVQGAARLAPLLRPYPSEEMRAYPVGLWVNDPAHDDPQCLQRRDPLPAHWLVRDAEAAP